MNRLLAPAAIAVLTFGMSTPSGPASSGEDGSIARAGEDIKIVEIGVDLDTLGVNGTYIVLMNNEVVSVSLDGYALLGCNAVSTSPVLLVGFGPDDVIGPGGKYVTANSEFQAPVAEDAQFEIPADSFLDQSDGGVILVDDTGSVVHAVEWGSPHPDCMPNSGVETAPTPTSSQSIKRQPDGTWQRVTPNPGYSRGMIS